MSLGSLMLQEYPYGVYQPGTLQPESNICLIQSSLDISGSPFSSSNILTLKLFLPPRGTRMNIIIMYDSTCTIFYINKVSSSPPIVDQFSMYAHWSTIINKHWAVSNIYIRSLNGYSLGYN